MKYCPYCGASLMGGAVSFCAQCGVSLLPDAKQRRPSPIQRPQSNRKPAKPSPGKPHHKAKKSGTRKQAPVHGPKPDSRDDGYDGYYDDVKPMDNGHTRDRTNPELIKRVVLIAAGTLIIVLFSVILMYVL